MAEKLQVGVIGLGKFGYKFGKTLVGLGHAVLGIDINPENVKRAQQVFTQVFQADAMNKTALEQLGITYLQHVLVSVGDSIAASTMISMYLKELGIPKILVKAINSDHEKLLLKVGVDEVIIPEHVAAKQFANRIANPGFIEYLPFDTAMVIKELLVKQWAGKKLRDLDLTNRYNTQVIAIRKAGKERFKFIPKADDKLESGDTLVALGHNDTLRQIVS